MPPGALKAKADYASIAAATGWKILPLERYNDGRFDSETRQQKIRSWLNMVNPGDQVIHQFP
ncbi:MAG TPA: beta-1,6-galactofuranosyltransferase, partial [Leuconostoc mesenteroides]|nr:beta-1,6-galactofuranosyltransferase [Leuconostoc mesenteroides]